MEPSCPLGAGAAAAEASRDRRPKAMLSFIVFRVLNPDVVLVLVELIVGV